MSLTKDQKTEVIGNFRRGESDTGSPEVQVAILTKRIDGLTEHLRANLKDHAGRRGLLSMVAQRRKLLTYVRRCDESRYKTLIERLNIRR